MRSRPIKKAGHATVLKHPKEKKKQTGKGRILIYISVFLLIMVLLAFRIIHGSETNWKEKEPLVEKTQKVVFAGGDVFHVGKPQNVLGDKVNRSGHLGLLPSDELVDFLRLETERQKKEHMKKVAGLKGPIEHLTSKMCWNPPGGNAEPKPGAKVVLYQACSGKAAEFKNSAKGVLTHSLSNLCIRPDNTHQLREANIMLSDKCDDDIAEFELTELGDIRHKKSKFCIHIKGGLSQPPSNTGLVLFDSCGEDRNFFRFYVSIEKDIPGPPPIIQSPDNLPKKVAVSILITKDPGLGGGFLDSTAALAQSVLEAKSEFQLDLVAIVSPQVQKVRPALERMGYRVIEKPLPIELEEIKNRKLADEIAQDGCCGPWEFLKLWAWTLEEYDRVLQVDADVHFHRNFDEVFKYNVTLVWAHGALGGSEVMNGGFLVVRPNRKHFDEMVSIVREGDWREGTGWLGKCCWTYGGRTIQGLVPAYYIYILQRDHYEIERCRYDNMVEINRCRTWRFEDVKSNHFTFCQKPWFCLDPKYELCEAFTNSWWKRLASVKQTMGFPEEQGRCDHGYKFLDWSASHKDGVIYSNQVVKTSLV